MKKATIIAIVATLTSMMFAGVNLTWGNTYADNNGSIGVTPSFGVWFDVNDQTAIGWENGAKVSLSGPAASDFRLGYDGGTSLGVNWNWWDGTGTGWNTSLGTAVDFVLTDDASDNAAFEQGDYSFTINLSFGF